LLGLAASDIFSQEYRQLCGGLAVIAANAGGWAFNSVERRGRVMKGYFLAMAILGAFWNLPIYAMFDGAAMPTVVLHPILFPRFGSCFTVSPFSQNWLEADQTPCHVFPL